MSEADERDYYLRRECEERLAAVLATHPVARDAHLTLAERYRLRADAGPSDAGRQRNPGQ